MQRKHKIIPGILLTVCLTAAGIAGYMLHTEIQKELSIIELEKETIENFVLETPPEPDNNDSIEEEQLPDIAAGYQFDWDGMKSVNTDVIGWIRFDNPSRINYPIVQSTSNQFYLNHDWRGYYQFAGAIFLNKSNNPEFKDANSVIYGHRMIGGSMFGDLGCYSSLAFMNENPYFYIYTPDGKVRTYEIFSYSEVIDGSDTYNIEFESMDDRSKYFQAVKNQAVTFRDIPLTAFDTTVTLSTCANYGYYNRMVLEGKLIKIEVQNNQ